MVEKEIDLKEQIVILIGPEGAGKSMVGRRLAQESEQPYISTGDLIRSLALNDHTVLGEECRELQKVGKYLSPHSLTEILASRFRQPDTIKGLILDGGLRTLEETRQFPQLLVKTERVMPVSVVYLNIPRQVSIERLVTGPSARRRGDDTLDGVLRRLSFFHHQLDERLTFIKHQKSWRLLCVDSSGTKEETFNLVCQALQPAKQPAF